jgi:hypothetical protein
MPIDTGIYANLLRPPRSVAEYDADAQAQQMNALALQGARLKADDYQRGVAEQAQLRQAVQGFGADETANYNALLRGGFLKDAQGYRKTLDDRAETLAKTRKEGTQADGYALDQSIKAHEFHVQQLAGVQDPQTAMQWAQEGLRSGVFTPEQYQRGLQSLQQASASPQSFAEWRQRALQGGMSATEQLKAQADAAKQAATVNHQELTRAETARSHRANEGTAAAHLGVAQANLGLSRERLAQEKAAPKGVLHDTDAGTMLVDPRTGEARPVLGPDGAQLTKPLKPIPATANDAIMGNQKGLQQVERALALLDGKNVGAQTGDAAATGWKGYLPNTVLNRIDPRGVDARAEIADIGSLKIHDRSGAAVTLSEAPRLMPFIPLGTDDAATVKKKLGRLRVEIKNESDALASTYSKEQGYRPSPVNNATQERTASAGKPARSVVRTGTQNGRKVVQYNDGSIDYAD